MSLARQIILPSGGGGGGNGSVSVSAGTATANLNNIVFGDGPNGVSFGLNGSTITASVAAAGGAQTAISGIIVSDATYTSGTVSFSNQNGVTIGSSVNGASQYIRLSVANQSNQSAIKAFGVSNTGATAGNTGVSTGIDWVLAGSNLLTMSQSTAVGGPNTVWVQHPAWLTTAMASNRGSDFVQAAAAFNGTNATGTIASNAISVSVAAQSNQSAIKALGVSNTGATAGNTGVSTGIDWVLAGSQSITLSQSTAGGGPNTIWFQHPAWLTTADLSANSSNYVRNWKLTGNTAGTTSSAQGTDLWFSGGNSITVSGSSNSIVFSVGNYLTTADLSANSSKYVQNWKLTGNTAGTTSSAQGTDLWFSGGNSITISGSSNSLVFSVGNYITTADLSQNSSKYVQNWKLTGNTAGTTSSAQGTDLWLSGGNNITISGSSNTILISAFNQTNQSAIKALGASNTGNTAGNTGVSTGIDWVFAGTGAVTVSESTVGGGPNTLWFSAPNAAAGNVTFSAGANSSGLGSVIFSNSNGVSFGLGAGSVITASVNAGGGGGVGIGITNSGNTAGTSGTVTTGNYYLVGSGAITLSQSSSGSNGTLTITVPDSSQLVGTSGLTVSSAGSTISIYPAPVSEYVPIFDQGASSVNSTLGQSSLYFVPFDINWPVYASRVNFFMSVGTSTNTQNSTGTASHGIGYGLYTRGTGASTERLSQLTSYSARWLSISFSSNTQFNATYYNGLSNTTSHSTGSTGLTTSNASTFLLNSIGGYRVIALPVNLTLTPGRYWMGVSVQSTTTNQTNMSVQATILQSTYGAHTAYRPFGTSSAASNASVYGVIVGVGTYSAQSAGWPATIGLSNSDIRMPPSITVPYFNFSGISTSSNIL